MHQKKSGIALLITVMFVIVITVAIGVGLKQVNLASKVVQSENFMYQSTILVEDILNILSTNKDIATLIDTNSSEVLYVFLSQAAFIPFEAAGLEIVMKIKSARGKFSPNMITQKNLPYIQQYLNANMINSQYLDILLDSMSKIKEDNSYNSAIFDDKPYLFRDYIVSKKHLQEINNFYTREFNDNSLKNIDFDNLFYFSSEKNLVIDLNYATAEVWEMLLGCTKERAEFLFDGGGMYTELADLDLNDQEKESLKQFKTSFYEPILFVEIDIKQNNNNSLITFEYDIKNKKGSNFVYEI